MDPLTASALIAAGSRIIGGIFDRRQQNRNVDKTNFANIMQARAQREHDFKMAEYGYDKDLEMWKLQNEYNSPAAQMARFQDAGLNKHMIYGQGTPGNATGMPTYQQAQYQRPALDYRGRKSVLGQSLSDFTGVGLDVLQLLQAKEKLAQSTIDTRIQKATENARTERQVNEAIEQWYRTNILNMEYDYKNFGVDNAETGYKVILRHMLNNSDLTEDQMRKILSGIALGKEVKDILKAFGFGSLIGNVGRRRRSN